MVLLQRRKTDADRIAHELAIQPGEARRSVAGDGAKRRFAPANNAAAFPAEGGADAA
jgi:hypothetical protein